MKRSGSVTLMASGAIAAAAMTGLFTGTAHAATVAGAGIQNTASQLTPASVHAGVALGEHTAGKHDCKGKNECKGQGGCQSGDNGCEGKNSCKGHGGCNSNK